MGSVTHLIDHWESIGFQCVEENEDGSKCCKDVCIYERAYGGKIFPCEWLGTCQSRNGFVFYKEDGQLMEDISPLDQENDLISPSTFNLKKALKQVEEYERRQWIYTSVVATCVCLSVLFLWLYLHPSPNYYILTITIVVVMLLVLHQHNYFNDVF